MGLRINTNISALTALSNLVVTERLQTRSVQRLSTGLRINRASDDPAGLVISEQLRAQLASIKQALENSQNAKNMINVAEAALNEANRLLIDIRDSAVFALNTGGASAEQIRAEQDSVDFSIEAIQRIANTTRFATRNLLNGASEFAITDIDTSGMLEVRPLSLQFDPASNNTTFRVDVTTVASQALAILGSTSTAGTTAASGGDVILRIRGPIGSEEINLNSGADNSLLGDAINLIRGNTGVYASGGFVYTEEFGSETSITLEQIGGDGEFSGGDPSSPGFTTGVGERYVDFGEDASASVNGANTSATGNVLNVVSSLFTGTVYLNPATNQDPDLVPGTAGTWFFTIANGSGLTFQFGSQDTDNDRMTVNIPNLFPTFLGEVATTIGGVERGGFLTEIQGGGGSDLFNDPGNALTIIDAAIDEVSDIRAFLGAFVNAFVDPAVRDLEVAFENLTASESSLRDLNFAEEVAEFTRSQILFQSGISVLAQSNLIPQAVLQLLQ